MPQPTTSQDLLQLASSSLKQRYGNTLVFLGAQELASDKFDYLPTPRPQAFVSITLANCSEPKRFFLETIDQTASPKDLQAKITRYLEYEASGVWNATGNDLPLVLMVCESADLVSELMRKVGDQKPKIMFATTTRAELEQADTTPNIWQPIHAPTKKLELHRLPDRQSTA